jgi:hypothetical protein
MKNADVYENPEDEPTIWDLHKKEKDEEKKEVEPEIDYGKIDYAIDDPNKII